MTPGRAERTEAKWAGGRWGARAQAGRGGTQDASGRASGLQRCMWGVELAQALIAAAGGGRYTVAPANAEAAANTSTFFIRFECPTAIPPFHAHADGRRFLTQQHARHNHGRHRLLPAESMWVWRAWRPNSHLNTPDGRTRLISGGQSSTESLTIRAQPKR